MAGFAGFARFTLENNVSDTSKSSNFPSFASIKLISVVREEIQLKISLYKDILYYSLAGQREMHSYCLKGRCEV